MRDRDPVVREFLLTFWKIHILHHAAEHQGVYGQWMLEELGRHGYLNTISVLPTRMMSPSSSLRLATFSPLT